MAARPTDSGAGVALKLLILALLAATGMALRCYDCSSEHDPNCGDRPFNPVTLGTVDCNLKPKQDHLKEYNATICRKLIQTVQGKTKIVRRCGYIEDPVRDDKACVQRSGTHDVSVLYCSCKGELCNAAPARFSPDTNVVLAATLGVAAVIAAVVAPS